MQNWSNTGISGTGSSLCDSRNCFDRISSSRAERSDRNVSKTGTDPARSTAVPGKLSFLKHIYRIIEKYLVVLNDSTTICMSMQLKIVSEFQISELIKFESVDIISCRIMSNTFYERTI